MGEEVMVAVPESVLKKRKREEEWALAKKQELAATKKKNAENRKIIFKRAKQYSKEYEEQVYAVFLIQITSSLGGFFRGLVFECNGCFFYGDFRESNLYN
jgi:large subunit ribosomal protein L7e